MSTAVKRYVRRAIPKTETKQIWTHHNEIPLNSLTQGYRAAMPAIAQGATNVQRIGNVINLSALHLKGAFHNNAATESMVRFVMVGYPATNGDPLNNFFRSTHSGLTTGMSGVNGLDQMYFPINKLELHVYFDQLIKLGPNAASGNSNVRMFNKFIKLGRRKIEYKSNTTGVGNQNWEYSIIWLAADTNDDTSTGTTVEVSCLERLYFKDA